MRGLIERRISTSLVLGFVLTTLAPASGRTQSAPPEAGSAEITAVLDQEKPDPSRAAKIRADADARPAANADGAFYFSRCQARAALGRDKEAIADCEKAISLGGDYMRNVSRWQQFLSNQYRAIGEYKKSIALEEQMRQKFEEIDRGKGRAFGINLRIANAYGAMGDIKQMEVYVKRNQALWQESKSWRNRMGAAAWEANVENGNGRLYETQGRYRDAELAYQRSAQLYGEAIAQSKSWPSPPPPGSMESARDSMTAFGGRAKAAQGRLAEGEADVRRALLGRLKTAGKYNGLSAQMIGILAGLVSEQARYVEAEQLARTHVEIEQALGFADSAPPLAFALNRLAMSFFSQGRWDQAGEIFDRLDVATKDWPPLQRDRIRLSWANIFTAYYTRKTPLGIELAQANLERTKARVGEKHFQYAMAQAVLAAGYVFARRDAEATQLFKAAMPALLQASRDAEDDTTSAVAYYLRLSNIVETYLTMLARTPDSAGLHAAETFQLRDLIGGRSVQRALEASSARSAAGDPALAALVRKDQDLEKQIAASIDNVNTMLALAPEERDAAALRELDKEIAKAKADRAAAQREIARKFPKYSDLVTPLPPTAEELRTALRKDEAFLAFYFGRRSSYVWVVPKEGPVALHRLQQPAKFFDDKIGNLRKALEPQAATIADIPPFDVKAAHELYELLLKPVEAAWKPARSLIMVTNGALGLLPLGLLPTAPTEVKADSEIPLAGYREVPWLARTHAVTLVPSAAALRTLRHLPAASPRRELLIGFGDPLFSRDQANEPATTMQTASASGATTRGVPLKLRASPRSRTVGSADVSALPALPDTADELKSIAAALQADPSKVLNLGKAANEETVRKTDLSKYRIIVFATHGLVPGDLEGLRQPALALSAPNIAGVQGDGLLTMEEILTLKLDADWVVLSACNTGAGAGAGAEAASGLARAFFYAGTRAVLVTNWSVHSASARALISDLFARQTADPKLSRAEALRATMMALLDGPGFAESGNTLFSYGHPLFWAPYSIIGDGG